MTRHFNSAWNTRTIPALISTVTLVPISRQGTLYWLVSISIVASAWTLRRSSDLMIGRTPLQRLQTGGLDPREPVDRPLAGRAMDAHVGDVAHPGDQMGLQRLPAGKAPSRQRVPLDVADPVLVLALGPRPVRRTGLRLEPPVTGKRMETLVERHFQVSRSWWVTSALALSIRTSRGTPAMREGPFQPIIQAVWRS